MLHLENTKNYTEEYLSLEGFQRPLPDVPFTSFFAALLNSGLTTLLNPNMTVPVTLTPANLGLTIAGESGSSQFSGHPGGL